MARLKSVTGFQRAPRRGWNPDEREANKRWFRRSNKWLSHAYEEGDEMSTRSLIAQEQEDGTIKAIYCHFDGYPGHVGGVLGEHYTDQAKVSRLLDLGGISVLAPELGEQIDFDGPEAHAGKQVLAYHRDRGEPLRKLYFSGYDTLVTEAPKSWAQFVYAQDAEGCWWGMELGGGQPWLPVLKMVGV